MGCHNTTVVNAPLDQVWKALRDFHDMSWAVGVVEELETVGDTAANQIGARRILNGVFHETLMALDDVNRSFQYQITDGPGPLSKDSVHGYIAQVRAFPVTDDDSTFVEWSSGWEASAGGVTEFCDPIYQALLGALKKSFE